MNLEGKTLILLFAFLIIFLGLIVLIIHPSFKSVKNDSEKLLVVKKDLALLEQKKLKASELREKSEALGPDLKSIQGLFVNPVIPIDFLQFLEDMALDSNMTINISLLPSKEKVVLAFPYLNFQLFLRGSFPNYSKFLEKLETAPYLIEVENLTMRKLTEKQITSEKDHGLSEGDAAFNLSIIVFTPLEKSSITE